MAYGAFSAKRETGYGKYIYTDSSGVKNTVHIFKTDPAIHGVAPATTSGRLTLANLNPPASACPPSAVLAKTNGNYLDPEGEGNRSFHGTFLAAGYLSKDGKAGIDTNDGVILDFLSEENWYRHTPSLCMKDDGTAHIHWFSTQSGGKRMTVADAVRKYNTIISGQHCLVHQSKSVFKSPPSYSFQGVTIADWNDLNNKWNHHSENLGSYNSKLRRARTFFGHAPGGICFLVCVEGENDWGTDVGTKGMMLDVAAEFMLDLGCDYALNMDGGTPTQMRVAGLGQVYSIYGGYKSGSGICAYAK